MSELIFNVDTPVPDSTGDFPSREVQSNPLLPDRHSATINGARFLSRLKPLKTCEYRTIGYDRILNVPVEMYEQMMTALYPRPRPTHLLHSFLEDGGLASVFS